MKKILLALILMLALFSGMNPRARGYDNNHEDDHDDHDDHDGCYFFAHG
jgi:hypothetical protein